MIETSSQSGGINNIGGTVNARDVIGGDQILHNIIVVGQVLNWAQVEGLLPNLPATVDGQTVQEALDAAFAGAQRAELEQAMLVVRQILGDVFLKYAPPPGAPFPLRELLKELPTVVYTRLNALGYWDSIKHTEPRQANPFASIRQSLYLESASKLWEKELGKAVRLELRHERDPRSSDAGKCRFVNALALNRASHDWMRREGRVFVTGLVLDLIRIVLEAQADEAQLQRISAALVGERKNLSIHE